MLSRFTLLLFCTCTIRLSAQTAGTDPQWIHEWNKTIIEATVTDGFSPKLASRTYTYPFVAAYEVLINGDPAYKSLQGQLNDLQGLPKPDASKKYSWEIAAIKAISIVGKKLVYREYMCDSLLEKQFSILKPVTDSVVFANSVNYGAQMGAAILKWAKADKYAQTKALPGYIYLNRPGSWKPTPPEFRPACEPNWGTLRTFVIKSAADFPAEMNLEYSADTSSAFYKANMQVYNIDRHRTNEQTTIAKFWDDNPDLFTFTGHDASPRRQMSPPAHWMGIVELVCKKENCTALRSAEAYALVSTIMSDVMVSCWKSKYSYNSIRPVTYIQENIDPSWMPLLVTPPFPEHPSGHSGLSAAAAVVMTKLFGDNYKFTDSSEKDYGYEARSFDSFLKAANEVSISRVYGGIHYMAGVNAGNKMGLAIGKYSVENIHTK